MFSKSYFRISMTAIAAILLATLGLAQPSPPLPVGTRVPVHIELAATSAEQLKHCTMLAQQIHNTTSEEQRFAAIGETMANLSVIPKTWPNDINAIVQSYLMQAEIASEWNMPRNAFDAMTAAEPLARSTVFDHEVQRRLGQSLESMGRFAEAEQHFLAAERSPSLARANRIEAQNALQAIAMFYTHQNQPREAMKRYDALADLPNQTAVNRAVFTLASLKEAVRIRDDAQHSDARREAATLDQRIADARSKALMPDDVLIIDSVARDAARVKAQFHL